MPRVLVMIPLLVTLQGLAGCVGGRGHVLTLVQGYLTPGDFPFKTITKLQANKPGGWRAVCVVIRITDADSGGGTTLCSFEVGAPIRIKDGREFSLALTQRFAAETANEAAYQVFSALPPGAMVGPACLAFRKEYELRLQAKIPGSRVGECGITAPIHPILIPNR